MTEPARTAKGLYWDRAWSLVEGCTRVSAGCLKCWSATSTHMRKSNPVTGPRYQGLTDPAGHFNAKIRLMHADLEKPLFVPRPTTWAIWNDLFHNNVSISFIDKAFTVMHACPQHRFLALTKRPIRAEAVTSSAGEKGRCPVPPNLGIGTTAETETMAALRISSLLLVDATFLFLSLEPLLDSFNLLSALNAWVRLPSGRLNYIKWVIAGCESGKERRPTDIDSFRAARDVCKRGKIPFFLKQMEVDGKLVKLPELDGRVWDQYPEWITMKGGDE